MAQKCVHKGCGKLFTDPEEECHYHPGPPVFHEGQKGWRCCKPRFLTFEEFQQIPPCTIGRHSIVDDTPQSEPKKPLAEEVKAPIKELDQRDVLQTPPVARAPLAPHSIRPSPSPGPPEDEDDDPGVVVPDGAACKRRACGAIYKSGQNRDEEKCIHHSGQPLFHEGSKGYTCCKRKVLEFDEFLKIAGCTTKSRHLFVGKVKEVNAEEQLSDVRNDFYQTPSTVIASLYLKKIDKDRSKIEFADDGKTIVLDLLTKDQKRYSTSMSLFGLIKPTDSKFKILGTKLELTLAKADGLGWPVLRDTDPHTGEIIQAGRAGRV